MTKNKDERIAELERLLKEIVRWDNSPEGGKLPLVLVAELQDALST